MSTRRNVKGPCDRGLLSCPRVAETEVVTTEVSLDVISMRPDIRQQNKAKEKRRRDTGKHDCPASNRLAASIHHGYSGMCAGPGFGCGCSSNTYSPGPSGKRRSGSVS